MFDKAFRWHAPVVLNRVSHASIQLIQ